MQPVITLFKTEFLRYSELCNQLDILPHEVKECEFFYTYCPPSAKLSKVLNVLKQNGLPHGIQFEPAKHPKQRRAIEKLNPAFAEL
jgi:hypothetical protein